jgi:hypothetical protein
MAASTPEEVLPMLTEKEVDTIQEPVNAVTSCTA